MNNRDIENFIKKEIHKETPDVLQSIKAQVLLPRRNKEEDEKMIMENTEQRKGRAFGFKPAIAFLMVVMAFALGALSFGNFNGGAMALASVVELDVNPSVELKLNSKGRIIKAVALNRDGEKILEDMDLSKTEVNVGVNAIIGSMYKKGYVNELQNSVLVSVQDNNKERGERLKKEITEQVNETLASYSVEGAVVSQSFKNGKETGKEEFIGRIIDSGLTNRNGEAYTKEELSQLNINELNVILNSKKKSAANTNTTGTASTKKYIGIEKAKAIAFADAKVNAAGVRDLSVDLDYENGLMIYEVDFEVGANEYDYDINAVTGAIVKRKVDNDDGVARNNGGSAQQNSYSAPAQSANGGNTAAKNNSSKPAQASPKTSAKAAPKTTAKATPKTAAKAAASSGGRISASKARSIALGNAGVSSPRDLDVEFDDGCWEVDFKAGGKEYDYRISASGKIIGKKVERDD